MMVFVKDLMSTHLIYGSVDDSLLDIIGKMVRNNVGCVVIMQNGIPEGIVTERDIVRNINAERVCNVDQKIGDMMSTPLITTTENENPVFAAETMIQKGVKKLVVVKENQVIGIITQTDIVKNLRRLVNIP